MITVSFSQEVFPYRSWMPFHRIMKTTHRSYIIKDLRLRKMEFSLFPPKESNQEDLRFSLIGMGF